jgi:DNA primase
LEAAGLVLKGTRGPYDRFRHRLIFPIMDVRGRVVGFGGRILDAQEPKYLNSPETVLYTKGRHLFGLAQAKDAILKTKTAVVVEGYFDCVVLAGGGVPNVVSPLGTALTADQVRLLKRYAEDVVLAFDADAAGDIATLRGIDLLVEAGLQVHVAQLPRGVDPDECLRSMGAARFHQLLDAAVNIFEWLVDLARRRHPGRGTEEKVAAAQVILPTLAKMPNAMLRSEYVRRLAERLELDEGAVAEELGKARPRERVMSAMERSRDTASSVGPGGARGTAPGPERMLTALILDDPSRWAMIQDAVPAELVTDPALRRILEVVGDLLRTEQRATLAQVISRLAAEGQPAVVTDLVAFAQTVSSKEAALEECVRRLQAARQQRHLAQLREQLQTAQEAGEDVAVHRLLADYQRTVKGGSR